MERQLQVAIGHARVFWSHLGFGLELRVDESLHAYQYEHNENRAHGSGHGPPLHEDSRKLCLQLVPHGTFKQGSVR